MEKLIRNNKRGLPLSAKAKRFRSLVNQHQRKGLSIAMNYFNDMDLAREVLTQTFMHAFARLHQLENNGHDKEQEGAWLFRILIQCCHKRRERGFRSWFASKHRQPDDFNYELEFDASNPDETLTTLLQKELFALVQKLPKWQRSAFVLRIYEDMTIGDISKISGHSEERVKEHLFAALKRIRDGLV